MSCNLCWTEKHQQLWLISHNDRINLDNIQSVQATPIRNSMLIQLGRIHPIASSTTQIPTTQISHIFNTDIDYISPNWHSQSIPTPTFLKLLCEFGLYFYNLHSLKHGELNINRINNNQLILEKEKLKAKLQVDI